MALAVWTAWFITHLPWTGLSGPVQVAAVLGIWVGVSTVLSVSAAFRSSLLAGFLSALLGLLLLGSKLVEPASDGPLAGPVKPNALFIALGFLALGGVIGLTGHLISRLIPRPTPDPRPDWLARFATVTAFTVAILLFIGGLVTSTNSGMAVPDWPRTYGANMFLYPLSGAAADIFLEHTHRLFGTLVGLATITLLIWTFAAERRTWVRIVAVSILALVIIQGVIGGFRVNANSRLLAMMHGVLGQLTFGLIIAIAAFLSPTFKRPLTPEAPPPGARRLKAMSTAFLHATILQLIFGAMYRHYRDNHSLYAHIAFSMVVLIAAVIAGFSARAIPGDRAGIGPILRRIGAWIIVVIGFQFILGWVAFLAGGRDIAAATAGQALIRTVHQANGALVLALAVLAYTWTRRLRRTPSPN